MRYQFRIKLCGISKPPVWRLISVPSDITFKTLSDVIQAAFEWEGYHLWMFSPKGHGSYPNIAVPHEYDMDLPDRDARSTKISDFFSTVGDKMKYIYDFGDDWTHDIVLEAISEEDSKDFILLKAKGMTPPEDCGGIWGYENLKEIMSDPKHEEYENYCEWLGMEEDMVFDSAYAGIKPGKLDIV